MNRVALISCTKTKADHRCTAKEMYWPSPLFKGAYQLAESRGELPLICSALHGVVGPKFMMDPYNVTLVGSPQEFRMIWAVKAFQRLTDLVLAKDTVVVSYLGEVYARPLLDMLRQAGYTVEEGVPAGRRSQGKRLAYYKEQLLMPQQRTA